MHHRVQKAITITADVSEVSFKYENYNKGGRVFVACVNIQAS